jgi:hypothetical protein
MTIKHKYQTKMVSSVVLESKDLFTQIIKDHISNYGINLTHKRWENKFSKVFPELNQFVWDNMKTDLAESDNSFKDMPFETFTRWAKILDLHIDVRVAHDMPLSTKMLGRGTLYSSFYGEAKNHVKVITPILKYAKSYIDSIEDEEITEEHREYLLNAVHAKLLDLVVMRWDTPARDLAPIRLESLAKVIIDKQIDYIKLDLQITRQKNQEESE